MTVNELIKDLSLKPISVSDGNKAVTGGYCGDLLSWVMGRASAGQAWITIMSNINVLAVATLCEPSCIVLAEDTALSPEITAKAREQGINILSSEKSSFELCGELYALLKQ